MRRAMATLSWPSSGILSAKSFIYLYKRVTNYIKIFSVVLV